MSTSNLTLTIDAYNSTGTGVFCTLKGITATGDARVAVSSQAPFTVSVTPNPKITDPLDLAFSISGPAVPGAISTNYNIQGIVFGGQNGSSVFVNQTGDGTNLVTIQDILTTVGTWEFLVIAQQVVAFPHGISQSSLGVIDPPIDNESGT